jgi:predicted peptidase
MKKIKVLLGLFLIALCLLNVSKVKASNAPVFISDYDDDLTEGTSFVAVVNGYDWGPAVDKIIISGDDLTSSVSPKVFTTYTGFAGRATEERVITAIYFSDENGNRDDNGKYVALELQVGPDIASCMAFTYDMATGLNNWASDYSILFTRGDVKIGHCSKVICPEADSFEMGSYTSKDEVILNDGLDNDTLTYAFWAPNTDDNKKPLIIWIHGAGEGGTDPYIAILGNRVVNLISDEVQKNFEEGAYVFAPQTPTVWMNVSGQPYNMTNTSFTSMYTGTLYEMIMDFANSHPDIDKDRIYIGGCSNGGYMTMNMIVNYPDTFAAAYPVCEAYSNSFLSDDAINYLKNIPIWFTHATNDPTVGIADVKFNYMTGQSTFGKDADGNIKLKDDFSRAAFRRLKEAGATDVHFFEPSDVHDTTGLYNDYQYNGHYSWIYVLKNESIDGEETLFHWISSKKLSDREAANIKGTPWEVRYEQLKAKSDEKSEEIKEDKTESNDTVNVNTSEEQAASKEKVNEKKNKSNTTIVIILVIVAFAACLCGYFAYNSKRKK